MSRIIRLAIVLFLSGLAACGSHDSAQDRKGTGQEIPRDVPGLEIEGPRTKANVIANMFPAVIHMQKIFEEHRMRNPDLEGKVEFKLTVDFNGEIGELKVDRSTMDDPEFEKAVIRPLQFMDFDGWGDSEQETEIIYPVEFET
jgi:hypothetical protein